jgi:hypothetical protein
MNNKGQMGGFSWITGIMVMVISILLFAAVFPVIISAFGMSKDSQGANCAGYTDPNEATLGAYNHTYNPKLDSDTLSCTILNFGPSMIVIAVVFGLVAGLIAGKLGQTEQPQQQPYYQQGY